MNDFERQIDALDIHLFDRIESQSSSGDRVSWLTLQRTVRNLRPSYAYLEIGSHLGGSIQQYLPDPRCEVIYSIDPRPVQTPDERGLSEYEGNSTSRMLENLRTVRADAVQKIVCFDSDAKDIDVMAIRIAPDLCFIDGEHTNEAVLNDFRFCRSVCAKNAIVYFHDDLVVYEAIAEILRELRRTGTPYKAIKLQGGTFAIVLGNSAIWSNDRLAAISSDGERFIHTLRRNALFARLIPKALLPAVRRAYHGVRG